MSALDYLNTIATLEVAYSPPYASAMDIINNAANNLENIIEGRHVPIEAGEFLEGFESGEIPLVLDVRSKVQAGPYLEK